MSTFRFHVGVWHFHPVQFCQVFLVCLVEEVRFADGDPVQFVSVVLLGLQSLVEITVNAPSGIFARHDGGREQTDVIKGFG
jgi:hypothetical protein